MKEDLLKTIQPYAVGIIFLLCYLAENIYPQRKGRKHRKHDLVNIAIGAGNAVVTFFGGLYIQQVLEWCSRHQLGLFNVIAIPFTFGVVLQLLLIDVFMYGWHRINHTWPLLWRFHRFHHLDEQLNSSSALRFHFMELCLSYVAKLLFFPLLGISVTAVLVYGFLFFPIVVLHHSNIRISESVDLWLRKVVVTPRMHRIHHSKMIAETNSNYSSVLSCWDALFGSYIKTPVKEIEFGVEE